MGRAVARLTLRLTAIPMAMGFAMAMGLRPEQGIIAGAVACLVGRTWGGSKYQVHGPTAAIIPVIAGLMASCDHGFLIFVSILAGDILIGLARASTRTRSSGGRGWCRSSRRC